MTTAKRPEDVRRSALSMAVRMFESGCVPCARSYLELARANGADAEALAAIERWMAGRPPREENDADGTQA